MINKKGCLRILSNKRGSMLIFAYFVIVTLVGLGTAWALVTFSEHRVATRQMRQTKAFAVAEAGIEQAIYDLRQDFLNATGTPSWQEVTIEGSEVTVSDGSYTSIPYSSTSLNGGSFDVEMKRVGTKDMWIRATGSLGDAEEVIVVYAKMFSMSPWDNAIFAGAGASGAMINGNVNIRGSVHILGTGVSSTDYVVDLGGTAELIGNNYATLDSSLENRVPALETKVVNGVTVETLNAELRIKRGIVGLSGSSTVGEANNDGNDYQETINGSFVTNGFGGSQGTANVNSDNGWSNGYDLGDAVSFPSLSDPYPGHASYQAYLQANALVISSSLNLNVKNGSPINLSDGTNSLTFDAASNTMTISGIVYVDGGNDVVMSGQGSDTTITYTGSGSLLVTGDVSIGVDLVTPSGSTSFPTNVMGIMTPNNIDLGVGSQRDIMGMFYAEGQVSVNKQTDVMGTIVSNFFDMGSQVPSIFQVPEASNSLPPGLIGGNAAWVMSVVSWQNG